MNPRRSQSTRVIVAGSVAAAVILVLIVASQSSTTKLPGSGLVHTATVVESAIPQGEQSPYWSIEVSNSGQEPIVGISIVRVVLTSGNQTSSLTGIQASPFEVLNGSCSTSCQPGDFDGPVSTSLYLNPGEVAFAEVPNTAPGAAQIFPECESEETCVVNLLVTYADGEVGILEAPISSG